MLNLHNVIRPHETSRTVILFQYFFKRKFSFGNGLSKKITPISMQSQLSLWSQSSTVAVVYGHLRWSFFVFRMLCDT